MINFFIRCDCPLGEPPPATTCALPSLSLSRRLTLFQERDNIEKLFHLLVDLESGLISCGLRHEVGVPSTSSEAVAARYCRGADGTRRQRDQYPNENRVREDVQPLHHRSVRPPGDVLRCGGSLIPRHADSESLQARGIPEWLPITANRSRRPWRTACRVKTQSLPVLALRPRAA